MASTYFIKYIFDKVGFKIINIELNNINGGSFAVTACKDTNNDYTINLDLTDKDKVD